MGFFTQQALYSATLQMLEVSAFGEAGLPLRCTVATVLSVRQPYVPQCYHCVGDAIMNL